MTILNPNTCHPPLYAGDPCRDIAEKPIGGHAGDMYFVWDFERVFIAAGFIKISILQRPDALHRSGVSDQLSIPHRPAEVRAVGAAPAAVGAASTAVGAAADALGVADADVAAIPYHLIPPKHSLKMHSVCLEAPLQHPPAAHPYPPPLD